jgi:hypothetical protein
MVAATVVLSVATTLITLAAEHMRRARHAPVAAADPQPAAPSLSATEAGHGEILSSDQHVADYNMYRADNR